MSVSQPLLVSLSQLPQPAIQVRMHVPPAQLAVALVGTQALEQEPHHPVAGSQKRLAHPNRVSEHSPLSSHLGERKSVSLKHWGDPQVVPSLYRRHVPFAHSPVWPQVSGASLWHLFCTTQRPVEVQTASLHGSVGVGQGLLALQAHLPLPRHLRLQH
jgi:hypothetical protein